MITFCASHGKAMTMATVVITAISFNFSNVVISRAHFIHRAAV